jgi:hypothetical protein
MYLTSINTGDFPNLSLWLSIIYAFMTDTASHVSVADYYYPCTATGTKTNGTIFEKISSVSNVPCFWLYILSADTMQ